MLVISSVSFVILLKCFGQISCLVELAPLVPNNNILKTEAIIRNVTNNLFALFKLDPSTKERNKNFTLVYNYLALLAIRDFNTLNKIRNLTKVNKNINASVIEFMTVINEILNETQDADKDTSYNNTKKVAASDKEVESQIQTFVGELKSLKKPEVNILDEEVYKNFNNLGLNYTMDFNLEDLNKISNISDVVLTESESNENNTIADDNEFWVPSGRRIYKGINTKIKHFPFMASVHIFRQFTCSGSIIKSDLVITAASCLQLAYNNRFFRENPKFLSVRIGSTFYRGGGEEIDVIEVFFHPTYVPQTLNHNLAIMRLHRNIRFSRRRKKVKKIKIDRADHMLPHNTPGITVVGWGAKTIRNDIKWPWSQSLAYALLDVYHLEDCMDVYSKTYVTRNHFCAGFISTGGGACNRDVGGPGIADGVLMGVISFGPPTCGKRDSPTVFTKLGFYTDWIDSIMEQENLAVGYARTTTTLPTSKHTRATTTTEKMLDPIEKHQGTLPGESLVTKATVAPKSVEEITTPKALRVNMKTDSLRVDVDSLEKNMKVTKYPKKVEKGDQKEIFEGELFKNFVKSVFGKEGSDYINDLDKDQDLRNNKMYKEFVETVLKIRQNEIDDIIQEKTTKQKLTKSQPKSVKTTTKTTTEHIRTEKDEENSDTIEEKNKQTKPDSKSDEQQNSMMTHYTKPIYDDMPIRQVQASKENKKWSEENKKIASDIETSLESKKSEESDLKKIQVEDNNDYVTHKIARQKSERQTVQKSDDVLMVLNDDDRDKELDEAIQTLMYIAENAKKEGLIEESDFNADDSVVFRTNQKVKNYVEDSESEGLNLSKEIYEILAETLNLNNITIL